MTQFKEMKFRVKDAEHSAKIQEHLFSLGYKWWSGATVQLTDSGYIFTEEDGRICKAESESTFDEDSSPEMHLVENVQITYSLVEVGPAPETVELNGQTYLKADLEEALAKLVPVKVSC